MLAASAVILAGGKSSRMGFDKQCIRYNGRLLIEQQINQLRELFEDIVIVTNRQKLYEGFNCTLAEDILKDFGPLSGIHAGLLAAKSKYSYFLACDMPNINTDYILYMLNIINSKDFCKQGIITCYGDWLEPFNSFYSKELIPIIEQAYRENKFKIGSVLKKASIHYISEEEARSYSPDWNMFANINTKEDLALLK
jgi:molybdopterin-guanine dinucleotide biosynthesis protein A